jgi:His-Xaa-Ser system radical SAM maturase HxsC
MRHIKASFDPLAVRRAHQVVAFDDLASTWNSDLAYMIPVIGAAEIERVESLRARGLANIFWIESAELEAWDVVVPEPRSGKIIVSYRDSDLHHSLFLTNRCNSNCLMCSQPPTKQDDGWLVDEAIDIVRHIANSPSTLGLSGGEPLLLGKRLREVLTAVKNSHPYTRVDVLTNGRLFSSPDVAAAVLDGLSMSVQWLVPLYGHADMMHDFVVQSPGAFEETVEGLLVLQGHAQAIQLRIVLVRPVLEQLEELCSFIGRNLPFVREVALMACEPIGFALANRELCEVDLTEWRESLVRSSKALSRHGVRHLFMNTPLCSIPRELWSKAHRSISDWKQVYSKECSRCAVKEECSGLFAWHERGWAPTKIIPIEESVA